MNVSEITGKIKSGALDGTFERLYGKEKVRSQRKRYTKALSEFSALYGDGEVSVFSVPGRSEISGNHTDHNGGKVLCGAIGLDIIAVAKKTDKNEINVKSEGYPCDTVDLRKLSPCDHNKFTSEAIIAGVCDGFRRHGLETGGFDAYTTSDVLKGSGLSSSAAFEVQICNILNYFYNDGKIDSTELAKISKYAENVYFGKPSGLMDQTACAVGGFSEIDFRDPENPVIEKIDFSLSDALYLLCIVNTGGNHADLNEDYASIPSEMKKVASHFGREVLRDVTYGELLEKLPEIRKTEGDRALLRALHFVEENERVKRQKDFLIAGNFSAFLTEVIASGNSSLGQLQNVYTLKNVTEQGLSVALSLCRHVLEGRGGAWRVHGGGFAGTVQAFVPFDLKEEFETVLNGAFGEGACTFLGIRPEGAVKII